MDSDMNEEKGIFIDLDNTLLPTYDCHIKALESLAQHLQQEYSFSDLQCYNVIETFRELHLKNPFDPDHVLDFISWRKAMWKKACIANIKENIEIDIDKLYLHYETEFLKYVVFDREIVSLLRKLKDEYKLIIITNGDGVWQRMKIERCSAMKYVDDVIIGGEHNLRKPTAELFLIACRKNGLKPEDCIMVGDKMSTDILGGKNAGFKATVLLSTHLGKYHDDSFNKPDFCIPHLHKLHDVLEKIR